jgi:catechol 2,3-dioxygenase-like lactoylglutathione lyase family enzyme
MRVDRISAVTIKVRDMAKSLEFYNEILGLEVIYGGKQSYFSSLGTWGDVILNLEHGAVVTDWGRIIFYVADVDEFWTYLKGKRFDPPQPRDAAWGERYFHFYDPDGHELSFATPINAG